MWWACLFMTRTHTTGAQVNLLFFWDCTLIQTCRTEHEITAYAAIVSWEAMIFIILRIVLLWAKRGAALNLSNHEQRKKSKEHFGHFIYKNSRTNAEPENSFVPANRQKRWKNWRLSATFVPRKCFWRAPPMRMAVGKLSKLIQKTFGILFICRSGMEE